MGYLCLTSPRPDPPKTLSFWLILIGESCSPSEPLYSENSARDLASVSLILYFLLWTYWYYFFINSFINFTLKDSLIENCKLISFQFLAFCFKEKIKMQKKKEPDKSSMAVQEIPVYWFETSNSVSRHYQFQPDGHLSVSFSFSIFTTFVLYFTTNLHLTYNLFFFCFFISCFTGEGGWWL